MPTCVFITHPEVRVDPAVPVPRWSLSPAGAARMRAFAALPLLDEVTAIWSSDETKAVEAAALLGVRLGVTPHQDARLGENDRSATGFLPPREFEAMADAFFATPDASVRGWERAVDAQGRIVAAVTQILAGHDGGDIAIVAHGGVGTLLYCHLAGLAIDRRHDQPGQGHYFAFDTVTRRPAHGWRSLPPAPPADGPDRGR